jgi:hypothetical protein
MAQCSRRRAFPLRSARLPWKPADRCIWRAMGFVEKPRAYSLAVRAPVTALATDPAGPLYATLGTAIAQLSPQGTEWLWSIDLGPALAAAALVGSDGSAYVTGATSSLDFVSSVAVTNINDLGTGSLRDTLAAAAPGSTLLLSCGKITFLSRILINKDITLVGPGAALTLSGGMPLALGTIAAQESATVTVRVTGTLGLRALLQCWGKAASTAVDHSNGGSFNYASRVRLP